MTTPRAFTVLVATDGSPAARAAVAAATVVPWPDRSQGRGVVVSGTVSAALPAAARAAIDEGVRRVAAGARRVLARRWPDAEVAVVTGSTVQAILDEARRRRASVVVVGAQGLGALSRLMLGSVSRGVVRHAACPVLVVKRRLPRVGRLVLAVDGSPHARQAAAFLAGLRPPAGTRVTVVRVIEPLRLPSLGLLPAAVRRVIGGQAAAEHDRQLRSARREVEAVADRLRRAGWLARAVVRRGAPLPELLDTVRSDRADLLVLGARGSGGVERLLLGSVAEAALSRCAGALLVVRPRASGGR